MEHGGESGGVSPHILNLDARCDWVKPRADLYEREWENIIPYRGYELRIAQPIASGRLRVYGARFFGYGFKKVVTFLISPPDWFLHVQYTGLEGFSSQNCKSNFPTVFIKQRNRTPVGTSDDVLKLIHTCHAAPLSFSNGVVFYAKVCVVTANIRTASPIV
jgi:hypothetical protein